MNTISVLNQQRVHRIASREFKKAATIALDQLFQIPAYSLSITFVSAKRMAEVNEAHLKHEGPTDIITFDYSEADTLDGELIICPAVAAEYGQRYNVPLGRELTRYFIHGVLHLQGHDDHAPNDRRQMKREENRLLTQLAKRFPVDTLANG